MLKGKVTLKQLKCYVNYDIINTMRTAEDPDVSKLLFTGGILMGKTVRTFKMEGVRLEIVSTNRSFDVYITIVKGTYLPKKREHHAWSIRFKTSKEQEIAKETIRIKLKGQKYKRNNLGKPFKKVFTTDDNMEIRLWIASPFYLSNDLRDEYWAVRDAKKAKVHAKNIPAHAGICTRFVGIVKGTKKATGYTNNNLFKPYQGGSCTPK